MASFNKLAIPLSHRAIVMSRLCYSAMCAFSLCVLAVSAVGCGGSGNTVIEDTRPPSEVQQEIENYDAQMKESASSGTNS